MHAFRRSSPLLALATLVSVVPTLTCAFPAHTRRDTCLYANATTLDDLTFSGTSATDTSTLYDSCYCLNGLPAYLNTDASMNSFVDQYGYSQVLDTFGAYIADSPYSQTCTYPPNSRPQCTSVDVCGSVCISPYVAEGNLCVRPKKRHLVKRSNIATFVAAKAACGTQKTVCGTNDRSERFQCIDVQTSLDSCGGCMVPNPFRFRFNSTPGVDCTAIAHVDAVSCLAGRCAVQSCLPGWSVNPEGTGCVEEVEKPSALIEQISRRQLLQTGRPIDTGDNVKEAKPHTAWRTAEIRSDELEDDGAPVTPKFSDDRGDEKPEPKADWWHIPDWRRGVIRV